MRISQFVSLKVSANLVPGASYRYRFQVYQKAIRGPGNEVGDQHQTPKTPLKMSLSSRNLSNRKLSSVYHFAIKIKLYQSIF